MTVRPVIEDDVARIGEIAEASGLFPAEYLTDMIASYLSGGDDVWLAVDDDGVRGFAFARAEEMTDRVWNVLAIAVDAEARRAGHGRALLQSMEKTLGARIVIIETTQTDDQAPARRFYVREGYRQAGHIPDFYAEGEDKITFVKVMP